MIENMNEGDTSDFGPLSSPGASQALCWANSVYVSLTPQDSEVPGVVRIIITTDSFTRQETEV